MKKIAVLLSFFLSTTLYASFLGNPSRPDLIKKGAFFNNLSRFSLRADAEADFVLDGKMEKQESGRIDHVTQTSYFGLIVIDFDRRLDFYSALGESNIEADWRVSLSSKDAFQICTESDYSFSWAFGTNIVLLDYSCCQVGFSFRYQYVDPTLSSLKKNGESLSTDSSSFRFHSYDTALGFSYHADYLTPYLALQYRIAKGKVVSKDAPLTDDGGNVLYMESQTPVGLAIGISLCNGNTVSLTLEGRVICEEAISLSGSFRF